MANLKELGIENVIDCHTHSGGIDIINMYSGRIPYVQSVDDLVLKAEINGIDKLITFPLPSSGYFNPRSRIEKNIFEPSLLQDFPYQVENMMLIKSCEEYTKQVYPFLCIDPLRKTSEQLELLKKYWEEKKFFGLKLHTLATGTKASDILSSHLCEFIEKNNIPITIHTGILDPYSDPLNCIKLSEALPNIKICIAHMGRLDNEIIKKVNANKNLFIDCCPWLQVCYFINKDDPSFCKPNLVDPNNPAQSLFNYYQILKDHLMWGTDEPWTKLIDKKEGIESKYSYKDEVEVLIGLNKISPKAVNDITNKNTNRFLFG